MNDHANIQTLLTEGKLEWYRWQERVAPAKLFDGDPKFSDPLESDFGGTCYIIAAMSAVAMNPTLLKDMFLTKEYNTAGIYGLKFYIRGKPWVVDVDDRFLFLQNVEG